jgi:hypothetical protein
MIMFKFVILESKHAVQSKEDRERLATAPSRTLWQFVQGNPPVHYISDECFQFGIEVHRKYLEVVFIASQA